MLAHRVLRGRTCGGRACAREAEAVRAVCEAIAEDPARPALLQAVLTTSPRGFLPMTLFAVPLTYLYTYLWGLPGS